MCRGQKDTGGVLPKQVLAGIHVLRNFYSGADRRAMKRRIAAFGQRDGDSAVGNVVGRLHEAGVNRVGNKALQGALLVQVDPADQSRRGFNQDDGIACVLEDRMT